MQKGFQIRKYINTMSMLIDLRNKTTHKMNKENKDKTPSNYYQHNGKKNNICNCYKIIIF